jgi:hypothetical protein
MFQRFGGLSPGGRSGYCARLQDLITFWNEWSCSSDAGETNSGVTDLQVRVTDCLMRIVCEIRQAESLTAQAALLLSGQEDQ